MRYTDADVQAMLESLNNQVALNSNVRFYLVKANPRSYVTLYQLKTVGSNREMSEMCDSNDMHEVLAALVRVLQHINL